MSVISQHNQFIERNGGIGVFRWIMEQDGIEDFDETKIYPVIAWNEFHHDDVIVIASAYRHKDFFVIINYEEDFSYLPERIRVWVEEVMDITGFDNIVEVFRDNHMISIYDENMEMMIEWYGEDLGVESLINFASYQNNILLDDEIDLDDEDVMDEYEINFNTTFDLNSAFDKLMKEFLKHTTNQNSTYKKGNYYEKEFFNIRPEEYNKYFYSSFNPKNLPNKTQIWDDVDSARVKKTNKGFDEDFREKWA
jgi:hypothetical protein